MRRRAKTTDRGLGYAHQKARKAMPAPQGEPCPYCGLPMVDGQALDADHALARVLGGVGGPLRWAHYSCNRRAGAALGNRIRSERGAHLRGLLEPKWKDRWS